MKTLIMGLGNPILGDDGAGWQTVEALKLRLEGEGRPDIHVECASLGGLALMERLAGYGRVILVDSMQTGSAAPGAVSVFHLESLRDPMLGHSASAHDASLLTALQAGRKMGMDLPETVLVVAIEAAAVYEFSEELSPAVSEAVPIAVQAVMDLL